MKYQEFTDTEMREEAEYIVRQELNNDALEALDMFTKDTKRFNQVLDMLKPHILADKTIMNILISDCVECHSDWINESIRENQCD